MSLTETLRSIVFHCRDMGLFGVGTVLSRARFRAELREFGLLGSRFGVDECRRAVEGALQISVDVEMMPDAGVEDWSEDLASSGDLAELCYSPAEGRAIVVFRESLLGAPWPAYELAIFHELAHLIGRHHETADSRSTGSGRRCMEAEADQRAKWLLLASLYPESFAHEAADRVA